MTRVGIAVLAIALLGACDKGSTESATGRADPADPTGAAGGSQPSRTWPADAPSAIEGCEEHADCTVVTWDGPLPPDPCCDARVGYLPVRVAFLQWMSAYRERACRGVECPTPPLPGAEPACCAGKARCVEGRCISACDDPTAEVPQVSILDPTCSIPIP